MDFAVVLVVRRLLRLIWWESNVYL